MLNRLITKAYITTTEKVRSFVKDERGVTAIEYGLIAVAMAVLISFSFYGDNSFVGALKTKFADLKNTVSSQVVTPP